jgi:hypothetical protein
MCEYLDINIYTEPHLIHIAKAALEAPLPVLASFMLCFLLLKYLTLGTKMTDLS